jgi:hypothetical protein
MKRASSLARNAITPATSSGVAPLPIGRRSRKAAITASLFARSTVASVEVRLGATALIRTPREPSVAIAFVRWGCCESDERFLVYRIYALRGSGNIRHRELLRKIWLRFSHARQVGPDISSGRGDRSLISAIYPRKSASTQSVVRLLAVRWPGELCPLASRSVWRPHPSG